MNLKEKNEIKDIILFLNKALNVVSNIMSPVTKNDLINQLNDTDNNFYFDNNDMNKYYGYDELCYKYHNRKITVLNYKNGVPDLSELKDNIKFLEKRVK